MGTSLEPAVRCSDLSEALEISSDVEGRLKELELLLGVSFSWVDAKTGELASGDWDTASGDWTTRGEVCREVALRGTAEVIEESGPFLLLAVPLLERRKVLRVAVAGLLIEPVHQDNLSQLANALSVSHEEASQWASHRRPLAAERLLSIARLFTEREQATARAAQLEAHVGGLSENLSYTYEEISLLHRITANLKISAGADQLAQLSLQWLYDLIPAQGLAAYIRTPGDSNVVGSGGPSEGASATEPEAVLSTRGVCPLDESQFAALIDDLAMEANHQPWVVNDAVTQHESWQHPEVRQLIIVPLAAGDKVFGCLAAINHTEDGEFGTVEANLLGSIGAILGIHNGNTELYREQVQLLSGMVQSLVSAIDAKDPYTCGHSNRVACVALRLAEQLDCSDAMQHTVYLSGLLHDVGKIGVDDHVLRKPGALTAEEFEHVKRHPELGYKILCDINDRRIQNVLPGVRYHHEAWDGSGYPAGLVSEEIPYLARIIAVADAFDAMSSDRPYRQGLGEEKLDQILRDGAGQQWDATIIDAFFEARDDIRVIANREREQEQLDHPQWTHLFAPTP